MTQRKITIFFLLILAISVYAEFRIAKDRTPGGLYIVGPDISPDSLEGAFIYYSTDAGTTLIVKYTPDSPIWAPTAITADSTLGSVYTIYRENLRYSDDYGSSWDWLHSGFSTYVGISAGRFPGEIFTKVTGHLVRSLDYGVTFDTLTPSFIYHHPCVGNVDGELYGIRLDTRDIYYSSDNGFTNAVVNNVYFIDYLVSIRRGTQDGEVFILAADSLYYSSDHCSTLVGVNTFQIDTFSYETSPTFYDIVGGNFSGQVFGYSYGLGWLQICLSEDYGANFTCIKHSAEGMTYDTLSSIKENLNTPELMQLKIFPNPFNSFCSIYGDTDTEIAIYTIDGKLLTKGKTNNFGRFFWYPQNTPTGIYLIKSQSNIGKVFYAK